MLLACAVAGCGNGDSEVAETDAPQSPINAKGILYEVSPGTSVVMWEGYKPGRTHTGTVDVVGGSLTMQDDKLLTGSFKLDMSTITVTDLEPGKGKERLEAHLKGTEEGKENDFFNIKEHPTGSFKMTKVTALENDPEANYMVYGNLHLKGITKNVGFRVQVEMAGENVVVTSPLFKIDRTEWDLKFMSNNFFDNLGDNFVEDEIGIAVNLVAAR